MTVAKLEEELVPAAEEKILRGTVCFLASPIQCWVSVFASCSRLCLRLVRGLHLNTSMCFALLVVRCDHCRCKYWRQHAVLRSNSNSTINVSGPIDFAIRLLMDFNKKKTVPVQEGCNFIVGLNHDCCAFALALRN